MKEMAKKLGSLIKPISQAKGDFSFFALTLQEDSSVWDLLVAAKWIDLDRKEALNYLAEKIQSVLTTNELLNLSGIILLKSDFFTEHSSFISYSGWEESDRDLYGISVKKAYIFVASDVDFHVQPAYSN